MAPLVDVNWTGENSMLLMAALVSAASVMAILLAIALCGCGKKENSTPAIREPHPEQSKKEAKKAAAGVA